MFESVFEFNPKMPDLNGEDDGKDQMFAVGKKKKIDAT